MISAVVTGYASLDYVARLEGAPRPNATVIGARGGDWPRLGGSPSYVATAMVRAGLRDVSPVTWVAADPAGAGYIAALRAAGVPTGGVAQSLAGATPCCVLAYGPDGACYCLYLPGAGRAARLTAPQQALLRDADWVCLTVGPAEAGREVLARLGPRQRLAWVVKADADAFPPDLRDGLAARADLIVLGRGERPFVASALAAAPARPGRIVVETHGAAGVDVTQNDHTIVIEAQAAVAAPDPTGAGDTFVGGLLAALIGQRDVADAVRAGQSAARDMLLGRLGDRPTEDTA
jgi:ribokinase